MRGRVMALYSIVFLGSTPIGAPLAGWLSEAIDPRAALVMAGVAGDRRRARSRALAFARMCRAGDAAAGVAAAPPEPNRPTTKTDRHPWRSGL